MPYKDKNKRREKDREYWKAWNLRNPGAQVARVKARKEKIKQFLRDLKNQLGCSRCAENDARCLDFHHLEPSAKSFNVAQSPEFGLGMKKIQEEIAKCIILCANCHRKEHAGP